LIEPNDNGLVGRLGWRGEMGGQSPIEDPSRRKVDGDEGIRSVAKDVPLSAASATMIESEATEKLR
jgi:hypothetical protein